MSHKWVKTALLAVLLVPSFTLALTFNRPLSLGISGSDVTSLQQLLASDGFLSVQPTGYFGTLTQTAVEEYQSTHGIVSSGDPATTGYGAVGPKTLASLNGATLPAPSSVTPVGSSCSVTITRTLGIGFSGSDVTSLQDVLIRLGLLAQGNDTGYFGNLTQSAIEAFQSSHGIVSSGDPASTGYGAVGPRTRLALATLTCTSTTTGATTTTTGVATVTVNPTTPATITNFVPTGGGGSSSGGGGSSSGGGGSSGGGTTGDTSAPSVPTNLSATTPSATEVDMTWSASTDNVGVVNYILIRNGVQIATPTGTSYQDTGLSPNTLYTYTVESEDAAGNESASSVAATVTTPSLPVVDTTPPVISNALPSGTLIAGTVQTSMSVATNEAATCAYSTASTTAFTARTTFSTTGSLSHSTVITGLTGGTSYTYFVECKDTSGNVSPNTTIAFSVATPASPVVTLSASPSTITAGNSSTLTWNSTNATSCTASGSWTGTKATSGTQSVSPTANASYTLTCTGAGGSANQSATVTVNPAPDTTPPSIPANVSGTAISSTQVNLSWSASTDNIGVTGYKVFRNGTQVGTPATNSYSDTGLTASTQYTYTVKAVDAAGNLSAASNSSVVTTPAPPDTTPPTVTITAPTANLAANTTQTTLAVTTNEAATCRYSTTSTFSFASGTVFSTTGGTSHSTTLSGLQNSTSYTYYVKCQDTSGNTSGNASVAFSVATPAPTVSLTANPTSITSGNSSTLTYSSTNATSCTGTNFTPTGTSGTKSVSPTTSTTYTLSCTGAGGNASINASVTVTAAVDTTAPSTPTNLSATVISSSQINLTWTASTDNVGVTGYNIYRGGTKIGTSATNSYSSTGLTASTAYTYTVSAFDAAGNTSAQSTSAGATTQSGADTTPPTVTITAPSGQLAANTTSTTLTVTTNEAATCAWSNVSGTAFASMTTFATTGGTSHSTALTGLTNGTSYTTYVECKDTSGNISSAVSTAYSVASAGTGGTSITIGETTVLGTGDNDNGNFLVAQNTTLAQTATIQSLSFYVGTAAGTLTLGIYDATGPNGGPGALKAQTASFTPVAGWNTQNVLSQVSLPAGTYWLAYLPSSNSLGFKRDSTGSFTYASQTFGAMPSAFPASPTSGASHWSFYATLVTGSGGTTPTATLSASPTSITSGNSSTLTYSSTNATSCTGTNFTPTGTSGTKSVSPTTSTTYSITCTGTGGSASASATVTVTSGSDTQAPTTPTGLSATAVSSSGINLSWTSSTDNVGVTGYKIFRAGTQVGTATTNSYSDSGLTASTAYSYTVSAYDAAGNNSAQSTSASATTQASGPVTCNLNATVSNFASQVSAATAGQTICLATGNYGTWTGTNKAITITAASGATPTMMVNFGSGDGGFTLSNMGGMGGTISSGADNITIKNSAFTSALEIDNPINANLLIDHNTSTNVSVGSSCDGVPAHFYVSGDDGVTSNSGVTISNNIITGGDADGIRPDAVGVNVLNNIIYNVEENGPNDCAHTDAIQFYGGTKALIKGNYIYDTADGIVAYDGTSGNTIEDNVVDLITGRYGIELYSDTNSIVAHNTLIYRPGCDYDSCGRIELDRKSSDPAGTGTQVYDNVAYSIDVLDGSSAGRNDHNLLGTGATGQNVSGLPTFVGGASPTTWAGYGLTSGSAGKNAADDGTDMGINTSTGQN